MKKILLLFLIVFFFINLKAQNTFPTTGSAGVGTTSPAAPLHVYRNQSGVFLPLFMLEDKLNSGYTQMAFKGSGRQYHIGVGNSTEPYFNLANKFYIWDQDAGGVGAPRMVLTANGYFGFGTTNPSNIISIYGTSDHSSGLQFMRLTNASSAAASNGKVLSLDANGNVILVEDDQGGLLNWTMEGNAGINPSSHFFGTTDAEPLVIKSNNIERMRIAANGNISIGTDNAQGYRFAVNGDAIFTKIKVKLYSAWPDYVFNTNYNLMPLNQLESFILANRHLPGLPTAEEVEKDGVDLGETQKILLEKIEELTLHLIEQDKMIKMQQLELKKQSDELKELKKLFTEN